MKHFIVLTGIALVAALTAGADVGSAAALAHRWSFTDGSLADAVEPDWVAVAEGAVKPGADGKSVQLAGGVHGSSTLALGADLLPDDAGSATIEMWVTPTKITNWGEYLCIGSSTKDYLVLGANLFDTGRPFLGVSGTTNTSGTLKSTPPGEPLYFALTLRRRSEGGTRARLSMRRPADGAELGEVTVDAPNWNLATLDQQAAVMGRSNFWLDLDVSMVCDELRIWRTALTDAQLAESVKRGPDRLPDGIQAVAPSRESLALRAVKRDELLCDWLAQDLSLPPGKNLRVTMDNLRKAFARHGIEAAEGQLDAGLAKYREACRARRRQRLAKLEKFSKRWAYARHYVMGGAHYSYTEALSCAVRYRHWAPIGGGLYLAEFTPDGLWKETPLLETQHGAFRDVDVSLDGRRLLYSFKADEMEDDYHLYEMDLETRKVRQITSGLGYSDFEGCYLPDGRILFNSTRNSQLVDCWITEASGLFRVDADGRNMWRMNFDQVQTTFPVLNSDGTVFYTRWEYNDRSQMFPQPLFRMAADGTHQRAYYGANSWYPTTITHARQVGDGPMFFAVGTGHHSWQPGELLRFDPRDGREEAAGAWQLEPLRRASPVKVDAFGQDGRMAMYPYPLNENEVVLSFLPEGWRRVEGKPLFRGDFSAPFGFYWTDVNGARELLTRRRGVRAPCGRPVPVKARRVFPRSSKVADETKSTGVVYVRDVYEGEPMKGVARGEVKSIRVVEIGYRPPAVIGDSLVRGRGGNGDSITPPSIGGGSWDIKKVWGEVPVAADGSVLFEAPARVPFYFQLVDAKGYVVQTMRSWTMLQPGETGSCIGCHEPPNLAPPPIGDAKGAMRRGCLRRPARGLSFPKDIQPILDSRCVKCHDPKVDPKRLDLTSAMVRDEHAKRKWTRSYVSLTHAVRKPQWANNRTYCGDSDHPDLNWVNGGSEPTPIPPKRLGAGCSRWFTERLEKGHCRDLTDAERRRLALWVDLGVPFCGDYDEAADWTPGDWAQWNEAVRRRERALKTYK